MLRNMGEPLVPVSINLSRLDFELCNILDIVENFRRQYDVLRDMPLEESRRFTRENGLEWEIV